MASSAHGFNKLFSSENHNSEYCNGFQNFSCDLQGGVATEIANTFLMSASDENVKVQDNEIINSFSHSDNYIPSTVSVQRSVISQKLRDNKSVKEIESSLEKELRKSSIQKGNSISGELYEVSLEKKLPEFDHGIKLNNNNSKKTNTDSFIQELTFDSLPDNALITIRQFKPTRNIALFISFNYDLRNHFLYEECNTYGFRALFHDIQDHVNIAPIVKLVTDVVINCWTYNCNITVFITSEPSLPISAITALLKLLRTCFDRKTLEIVIVWLGVYESSRPWIDEQCRVAKATACIQGVEVSDVIPQIKSYFNNGNSSNNNINGTMTLFDEKKITCYHEFNNSYPAAMKINDQIWLDAKQYFKHEMEMAYLTKINFDNGIVFPEIILYKALYNKFSQHPRLKHLLLSTRVASICFTKETCQCNSYDNGLPDSESIVKSDPKILELFINILKEVRYNLMQEERKKIKSEYSDLTSEKRNLLLLDLCN